MSPERALALSAASAPASPTTPHHGGLGSGAASPIPDGSQFVQVNLEALDLEALYPDSAKRRAAARNSDRPSKPQRDRFATLRSLGASMKGLVGSSSSSEDLSIGPKDDDPAVISWPSIPRTKRQWSEPVRLFCRVPAALSTVS
jgi:hypothetical protein